MTYDKLQASRAWCVAVRLREQANRLGVQCNLTPLYPESAGDLDQLEAEIQETAKRLSDATCIPASSLEHLISQLDAFGCGRRFETARWQY